MELDAYMIIDETGEPVMLPDGQMLVCRTLESAKKLLCGELEVLRRVRMIIRDEDFTPLGHWLERKVKEARG